MSGAGPRESTDMGQDLQHEQQKQIHAVIDTFMKCLVKKDSVQFYGLFHQDPVVWIGVFKDKTQRDRLMKDPARKNYFHSDYKRFYRSIAATGTDEEKFYNINIRHDESIAAVSFDYSFWEKGKKINWGQESWQLIHRPDGWKIVSVIFSMDFEDINPEPQQISK